MKSITVNLSYYNQHKALRKHIRGWRSWSPEIRNRFSFFVIDDCSQVPALYAVSGLDTSGLDLTIYRIDDDLYCNIGGSRNLGASECRTEWMIILDMDTMITESVARSMLLLTQSEKGRCFRFNRMVESDTSHPHHLKPHPAVSLLRRSDYWNVGGCDEDFVGNYGCTDSSFRYRSRRKLKVDVMETLYLFCMPDAEADITRDADTNRELLQRKKRDGSWSYDFIRFSWRKVYG